MGKDIFDLIIISTLAFFTLRGLSNGLIGEIAGICSLVFGFWAASAWNGTLAPYLTFIHDPNWRSIAACVIILVSVMLAIGLLARVMQKIASWSFVGWLNRLGGAILGFVKGVILWALLIIILNAMMPGAQFIREARAFPYFKSIIVQINHWLPPALASRIHLD